MDEILENGFCVKTFYGESIKVKGLLGEGGQGKVYKAEYKGQDKALKWYKSGSLGKDPEAFYENIKQNVKNGTPAPEFLWPEDITEWEDGTFGYIMDLRPEGYFEITEYLLCKQRFVSYRATVDAAMHIVSAFRILHNKGLSYQDLNDGNFFINPQNGKVLICDNDNVAPEGTDTGIIGKPRYMAPEIVLRKSKPNTLSDRFSMSVILYILFCLNHPLEGKRYFASALTPALQERLYGSEPVFMMDPDDHSNEPHPKLNKNAIMVWKALPQYMKDIFLAAFSKKSFEKPSARPTELAWLKALTQFRSDIVPCQCGKNEIFVQQGKSSKCEVCKKTLNIPFKLELSDYSVPAVKDSRIYRCQLGVCDDKNALDPIAQVVEKKESGALGIRNKDEKRWDAVTTKGEIRKVAKDEVVPLKDGIVLHVDGATITIKANERKGE